MSVYVASRKNEAYQSKSGYTNHLVFVYIQPIGGTYIFYVFNHTESKAKLEGLKDAQCKTNCHIVARYQIQTQILYFSPREKA